MHAIPRTNSRNILVPALGLAGLGLTLYCFGPLGPLVGLPIFCLLVHIFPRSCRTKGQGSTTTAGRWDGELPKVKLPVTFVQLGELKDLKSPGKHGQLAGRADGTATPRWNKITLFWKVVMILNSACWGSTFIATKAGIDALQAAGVQNPGAVFGLLRFALAAFPLLPWLGRSTSMESAAMSFLVGLIWGTSYATTFVSYTLGTTGAKAAFITSLQSLVVAACTSLVAGKLQLGTIFSALLAVLGVAFIELNGSLDPTIGDAVCMVAPICVGLGWYVLDKNMKKYPKDFIPSVVIQFSVFTLIFAVWLFKDLGLGAAKSLLEIPQLLRTPDLGSSFVCSLLFASILGNLLTMLSANVACRHLPVSDVSLIVMTEPLFAAVAAVCCIGETFSFGDCAGGFFIMFALLCNELWGEDDKDKAATMTAMKEENDKSDAMSVSSSTSTLLSKCDSGYRTSSASIATSISV